MHCGKLITNDILPQINIVLTAIAIKSNHLNGWYGSSSNISVQLPAFKILAQNTTYFCM